VGRECLERIVQFRVGNFRRHARLAGIRQRGKRGSLGQTRVGRNAHPVLLRLAHERIRVLLFRRRDLAERIYIPELRDHALVQVQRAILFQNCILQPLGFLRAERGQRCSGLAAHPIPVTTPAGCSRGLHRIAVRHALACALRPAGVRHILSRALRHGGIARPSRSAAVIRCRENRAGLAQKEEARSQ